MLGQFGTNITSAAPGRPEGLYLVVSDIHAARKELAGLGVADQRGLPRRDAGRTVPARGARGRVSGPAPDHASYGSFATFSDPDGNGWLLQESGPLPGPGRRRRNAFASASRSGERDAARIGRPRRAREAHRPGATRTGPTGTPPYMVAEQAGRNCRRERLRRHRRRLVGRPHRGARDHRPLSEGVGMASSLSIDVFNRGYKAIPGGPGWDDSVPATWPATTSTLITATGDALLVDALLTKRRASGWRRGCRRPERGPRDLRDPRPCRSFLRRRAGAGRLPRRRAVGLRPAGRRRSAWSDHRRKVMASWNSRFPGQSRWPSGGARAGQISGVRPERPPIQFRTIGGADGALASIVHVPDPQTVCSGDIAYNNIHMWLWDSTPRLPEDLAGVAGRGGRPPGVNDHRRA